MKASRWVMPLRLVSLVILLFVLPLVQAQITVDSFATAPDKVLPGQEIQLQLLLENVGEDDIEDIVVSIDLRDVPFVPVGSSTEKGVGTIRDGRDEEVYFTLRALPEAEPKAYKVPLTIAYGTTRLTSIISLEVAAGVHLQVLVEDSEIIAVGDQGKVILKFVNDGFSDIRLLKVILLESSGYTIISPSSLYIGDVEAGDFETEEFSLIAQAPDPLLVLHLEYRDINNNLLKEPKTVQLQAYTEEEALQFGLKKSTAGYVILAAALLFFVIIFMIYRKVRKRPHAS